MDIKQLNKTELQVMKYLWRIRKGFMKDIVDQFPQPGPAYTTISTLIGRMVEKKYIGFNKVGRDKEYFPLLKKNDYFNAQMKDMVSNFFNNSASQFASFFTKNADMSMEEMEELQRILQQKINKKKEL
ncbi:BlaI/MecI/CopY family transcriptional regulator [Antarcticibacterium flavum]|uniref:BlaI/MecI/CopY family transcriptional regulator n=1 Tax=Antarcticibacterium flavum TaxID=2058175 RepID=A0A5B7WYB7_9FLAO|nr:BlaI/MecI/CopY family transcriptional regulator [Antarcticibacterium flavum]MCM4158910.1 penicillinase repressor [Antarcticibacterium sp. W02-3]QCY68166.1 BlaI/MecI/CopY family transcriptional regulator [Antarcticibacterium flavum]